MLLEIFPRWPFFRRHVCPAAPARPHGRTLHGVPHHAHRSWVKTHHGIGWLHHHENDGWVVELQKGGLVKLKRTDFVVHIEEPK